MGERWRASRRLRAGLIVAMAFVLVAVTWYPSPTPGVGFDPSWQIALHLIADRGLDFGDQVVFTYGPLGFLLVPQLVTGWTWALALLATLALRTALVVVVIGATRRATRHLAPALVAGYLCAATLGPLITIPGLLAALVALVLVVRPVRARRGGWAVAPALGAAAALVLLMKLDAGALATVALGVAAWFQPPRRWRALGSFLAAYAGALVLAWVATGNDLRDVPAWLGWSVQVVGGYTGGASLPDTRVGQAWQVALFVAGLVVLALLAVAACARGPAARTAGIAVILAATTFTEFKHGFVRFDTHVAGTLLAVGLLPLMLRWRGRAWAVLALVAAAGCMVGALNAMDLDPWSRIRPSGLDDLGHEARLLVDSAERGVAIADARAAAREELAIDPAVIDAIGATPVHVAPHETSAIWAYGLEWRPEPQFQAFSTWTAGLDRLNADALAASDGPALVLRESVARLDNHNPLWESPRENLAFVCGFRRQLFIGRWELLARTADRCGSERLLARAEPDAAGWVSIPAASADDVVVARIDAAPGVLSRLRSLLFRPGSLPRIRLDGAPSVEPYRIPAALLDGPLIVRVPRDVAMPPRLREVVGLPRMQLLDLTDARVEFFALRMSPPAASAG